MQPVTFAGVTRIIGQSQGYIGLPLRDTVVDDPVTGPNTAIMQTLWQPTDEERQAIADGAKITLHVTGTAHPPVMLTVGDADQGYEEGASDIHDRCAKLVVRQIMLETIAGGRAGEEALLIVESVIVGIALCTIKPGGDDPVLDVVFDRARQRLAEIRLKNTEGNA